MKLFEILSVLDTDTLVEIREEARKLISGRGISLYGAIGTTDYMTKEVVTVGAVPTLLDNIIAVKIVIKIK